MTDWTARFAACAVALDRLETDLTSLRLAGVDVDDALDALVTARLHLGAGLTDAAIAVRKETD